jgi:hypothetical protein
MSMLDGRLLMISKGCDHFLIPMPNHDAPLLTNLIPLICKASLVSNGEGGDRECSQRAYACLRVLCAHVSHIQDERLRDGIIAQMGKITAEYVKDYLETMDEIKAMENATGRSLREVVDAMEGAGDVERIDLDLPKDN